MFLTKNDLPALKAYFANNLPEFSSTEINSMVKTLVINRLDISSVDYMISRDILFSESDLLYFRSVLKRLKNEEPFQHIVGEVEFYGLELKSDHRALIPRPETEELVDWIISDLNINENLKVLDLCGGSGCIALALKSVLKNAEVSCGEWSDEALQLIKENSALTSLDLESLKMDVLNSESYKSLNMNSYDCWVSNPPYIPHDDKKMMAKNVLDFEPDMALFVENDAPFVFYEMIAKQGQQFLKENGNLYFEIHENYGEEVMNILRDNNFVNIELRKDLQGRDRMIKAQKLSSQNESERS